MNNRFERYKQKQKFVQGLKGEIDKLAESTSVSQQLSNLEMSLFEQGWKLGVIVNLKNHSEGLLVDIMFNPEFNEEERLFIEDLMLQALLQKRSKQ